MTENWEALQWCTSLPRSIHIEGAEWKPLACGNRFAVYGKGIEVAKVPLTAEQLREAWGKLGGGGTVATLEDARQRQVAILKNIGEVRGKLLSGTLPSAVFGHPTIERNGWVYQVKMTPLVEVFRSFDVATNRAFVDDAIALIKELLHWGAITAYFALPVDFGLDPNGQVRMMGFGGLQFDRAAARQALAMRPWRHRISGVHMIPKALRRYFIAQVERQFTDRFLADNWGAALIDTRAGGCLDSDDAS